MLPVDKIVRTIYKGLCTACGKEMYLPYQPYGKTQRDNLKNLQLIRESEDGQCLEKPLCVKCLAKETGHDECTKEDCSTCKTVAEELNLVELVESRRRKVFEIQQKNGLHEQDKSEFNSSSYNISPQETSKQTRYTDIWQPVDCIGMRSRPYFGFEESTSNDILRPPTYSIGNDYSFEEKRLLATKKKKRLINRPDLDQSYFASSLYSSRNYETDSSYSHSSLSSGSTDGSSLIRSDRNSLVSFCAICETKRVRLKPTLHDVENMIPICRSCNRGHLNCDKEHCRICYKIAKAVSRNSPVVSFKAVRRKSRIKSGK